MEVLILIAIVIGISLLIYALIKMKSTDNTVHDKEDGKNTKDISEVISKSIDEVDSALEELNKLSESIITEINGKYQELLYLYNLIEQKQKEMKKGNFDISVSDNTEVQKKTSKQNKNSDTKNNANKEVKDTSSKENEVSIKNPKYGEIMELKNKGQNIPDIAKSLGMGQGEVKLIIELGKDR